LAIWVLLAGNVLEGVCIRGVRYGHLADVDFGAEHVCCRE